MPLNKKNFPYDLVVAYWEDIVGSCEWSDIPDIKKAKTAICCSCLLYTSDAADE